MLKKSMENWLFFVGGELSQVMLFHSFPWGQLIGHSSMWSKLYGSKGGISSRSSRSPTELNVPPDDRELKEENSGEMSSGSSGSGV